MSGKQSKTFDLPGNLCVKSHLWSSSNSCWNEEWDHRGKQPKDVSLQDGWALCEKHNDLAVLKSFPAVPLPCWYEPGQVVRACRKNATRCSYNKHYLTRGSPREGWDDAGGIASRSAWNIFSDIACFGVPRLCIKLFKHTEAERRN